MNYRNAETIEIPFRIVAIYLVISALWIYLSDALVAALFTNPKILTQVQTYKGLFFISVTAVLLYVLIRNNVAALQNTTFRLLESEEKYRDLVEHVSDWVWEINSEMVFTYSNPSVKKIIDYNVSEVIGKTPFDFMSSEDVGKTFKLIKGFMERREAIPLIENTMVSKVGRQVIVEVSGNPILERDGKLIGYRGIARDITERKRVEDYAKAKDREVRNAYIDVFSAVTGGRLVIMTDSELKSAIGKPITDIHKIESYSELSRARQEILTLLAPYFASNDILQEFLLAASEAITNAVKHAKAGTYQAFVKDGRVQLVISDRGPGIDFKVLPKATLLLGFSTKHSLGVGFSVMLELCDRVLLTTEPGKTIVVLEKSSAPYSQAANDTSRFNMVD
jgi:PAS domain S-box-containing protein